ncbi:MAG TPA: urate oxidase [Terriglobia bacterium]|nr:urate oxidase [Terriglobia bacterium]
MSVVLSENQYGKSRVRLVKVERQGSRHELRELTVDIQFAGDFAAAYLEGDNRKVLPTDTMKNTVYALARQQALGEIEDFGARLADHFLRRSAYVGWVRVAISENAWTRIRMGGQEHDHAFVRAGNEWRTAAIEQNRSGTGIKAGIAGLEVLKTAHSAFENFLQDEYTTLKDTRDRLLATAVTAEWTYAGGAHDYGALWRTARQTMLEVFAGHDSRGVQHTLYAMGEAVLKRIPAVERIELSLPNRHCLLVDLAPFGLDNPNQVFVPTDEPHGVIVAVLTRS